MKNGFSQLVYHFLAYSFCPVVEPLPVSCWFCSSPKRLRSIHHQVPYISIYVKKVEVEAVLTVFRETQTIISCVNKTYLEKYIYETESVSNIIIRSRQFSFPQGTKMRTGRKKIAKITDHHCVSSHIHLVFIYSEQANSDVDKM